MTTSDRKPVTIEETLLHRYKNIADGITLLFSDFVEVVIHDLHEQKIVYMANNFSKRQLGDESGLEQLKNPHSEAVVGPYLNLKWDGQKINSVSVVLRDDDDSPIGVMSINMLVSPFEAARDALTLLVEGHKPVAQPEVIFHDYWQEKINQYITNWIQENKLTIQNLSQKHKKELVEELYYQGAFKGKSAAKYVANILNMGRATVFKYTRELKSKDQPKTRLKAGK